MTQFIEDSRTELKEILNDKLEKEVVAFLNNKDGGNIYIGIRDDGKIIGLENIDKIQLEIKDRIKNNISPSALGLFDVVLEEFENRKYINVIIASGSEKPYHLRKSGMTPEGCYMRIGSSVENMPNNHIIDLFSKRTRNSLRNIISPRQDLSFSQLKIFYQEKNREIGDNLLKQLDLVDDTGKYNYVAYLLSDNNYISLKVAKYSGLDTYDLIENEEFGFCSLIKAAKNILNKFEIENRTFTKITSGERNEIQMVDAIALREAIINAIVHNDYTNEYTPKFEIFENRFEISSSGGLPNAVTEEDFLSGFSSPRNKELMRVFRDLDLVEQLGTGVRRILKKYDKDVFSFYPNFIRVSFKYQQPVFNVSPFETLNETLKLSIIENQIISLVKGNSYITQQELVEILNVDRSTITRYIQALKSRGILERIGSKKTGQWLVKSS